MAGDRAHADHGLPGLEAVRLLVRGPDWSALRDGLSDLLGPPSVDDAVGWAQFDPPGARVHVERTPPDVAGAVLMVKVADLIAAHRALSCASLDVSPVRHGGHEDFFDVRIGGLGIVVYASRPERRGD